MKINYVLIDWENVQPKDLSLLNGHPVKIKVFLGENQAKIATDLARALQPMGDGAEYIQISGTGRNAVDFHIALYLGELAAKDPEGCFHVISKDTGFDPLLRHLHERSIWAERCKDLAEIRIFSASSPHALDQRIDLVVENLSSRGAARPRTAKALASTINALFMKELKEGELAELIDGVKGRGYLSVDDNKVSYND